MVAGRLASGSFLRARKPSARLQHTPAAAPARAPRLQPQALRVPASARPRDGSTV